LRGDGHYDVSYPDGRRLVFDIRGGRVDESKPAYMEIDSREGRKRIPVRVVLEKDLKLLEEFDDYWPYGF